MGPRADRVRWIESTAGEGAAARRPGSLRVSRLLAAADETARRHPAAVAAALFCGGLATGTWLGRARTRARGEELGPRAGSDRSPAESVASLAPETGIVPDPAPERSPAAPSVARPVAPGVARLRNPIGSPSVLQP